MYARKNNDAIIFKQFEWTCIQWNMIKYNSVKYFTKGDFILNEAM